MKVKELMVGDWFLLNGKPMQVSSIKHLNDIRILEEAGETIEPAPITIEILEKNGFQRVDYNGFYEYVSKPERITLPFSEGSVDVEECEINKGWEHIDFAIKYVHELQHALRLAKIDKEVEL